jgi:hypothetical protein
MEPAPLKVVELVDWISALLSAEVKTFKNVVSSGRYLLFHGIFNVR